MAGGRLLAALLQACALLAACTPTPEERLSQAHAAIAAAEWRTAEIHLKNLLEQDSSYGEARLLLGEVLFQRGDLAGAEYNLGSALELGVDGVGLPLLRVLVAELKFKDALELIASRGLPTGPGEAIEVALLHGSAYRGLGEAERAVDVYRAALSNSPRANDVRTELAVTLFSLNQFDEGRALIAAVLADDPSYSPALVVRGTLEVAAAQTSAAEATFQQVVNLEQANAARSRQYPLAMAQLIETQVALGKLDAAAANADAFLAADGRSAVARYSKAFVEVQQGELAAAEARLEALIVAAPQFWPAHRLLGVINVRQDQLGQATMYLRTAVTNNPADAAARLQLAEIYVRQGDLEAARKLVEGSQLDESDGLFLAFAGGASQRAGLQQQAEQYFNESEDQAPDSLEELVRLANLYLAAGEPERAIRVLSSSTLQGQESRQVADYLLAVIHVRQGDLDAADALAKRLQEQRGEAAWPLNLRGVIALARRDANSARSSFTRALELEPRNVSTVLNLARVAAVEGDTARAEQYLRQALEIDPAQPAALVGLAQFALERRDFASARALLERTPQSTARMRGEAELLTLESRFDEAAQKFAELFATQPSEEVALRAYAAARSAGRANPDAQLQRWHADHPRDVGANFALAGAAIERNDLQAAERHYQAVVAENPNHAVALNNLAWIFGERDDPAAIEFGQRALAAEPNNPSIADTLGWLYVENGDVVRGLPLLAQAADALPDEPEVSYHLAVALAESGESSRAVEVLERLTADGRDFKSRAEAMRRLNDLRRRLL